MVSGKQLSRTKCLYWQKVYVGAIELILMNIGRVGFENSQTCERMFIPNECQ